MAIFVNPFGVDSFTQPKASLVGIVAAVLVAAWLIEGISERRLRLPKTPLDAALAVFFGWLVVATLFSVNFGMSLFGPYKWREGLFYLLCYGIIFYGAVRYLRGPALKRALLWAGIGSMAVFLYAIAQAVGLDFTTWIGSSPERSFSTLGNPLYLAAYTVLVVPIAAAFALASEKGSNARLLAGAVAVLGAVAMATSFSRGAWLGLVLAVVVFALLVPQRRKAIPWVVALVAVVAIVAAIPAPGRGLSLASRIESIGSLSGNNAPRVALWKGALTLIGEHPFVGVGPEAFGQEFARIKPDNWPVIDPEDKSARAHNVFLHTAATAGLPAAIGLLAALAILIVRGVWSLGWAKGRESALGASQGHEGRRILLAGMLAAICGYVLFLQFSFTMIEVTPLFWMISGALVAGTAGLGAGTRWRSRALPEMLSDVNLFWTSIAVVCVALLFVGWTFARQVVADTFFAQALANENGAATPAGIQDLQRTLVFAPNEPYYLFFLGKSYLMAAEQTQNLQFLSLGEQAYEQALALDRADTTLLDALGSAFYTGGTLFGRTDDFSRSEFYYKRSLSFDPTDSQAMERLGEIAFNRQSFGQAIAYFERSVAILPTQSSYWYNLGAAYENDHQVRAAEAAYAKALALDPSDATTKAALDSLLKRTKKPAAKR